MNTPVLLPMTRIMPLAPSLRIRIHLNDETIERYSEQMESVDDMKNFPPIDVYFDGTQYWLADGYLRMEAAKRAGHDSVWVFINAGTAEDAFWAAIVENSKHGIHLSQNERRRLIEIVVKKWPDRSNRMVAKAIGVSEKTVLRVRNELARTEGLRIPEKRIGLDGRMHPSRRGDYGFNPSSQQKTPFSRTLPPVDELKKAPLNSDQIASYSRSLIEVAFDLCPDNIETVFLGLFDEIVRRSGKDVGKKLMKDIFDRVVALRD